MPSATPARRRPGLPRRLAALTAVLPVCAVLGLGPALPLAHAVLLPGPDTLGVDSGTLRTYRPDPQLDADDNGILDSVDVALGHAGSGLYRLAAEAAQHVARLAATTPPTPAEQRLSALSAIITSLDGGLPAPDSDNDGFSDYEETFKQAQLAEVDLGDRISPSDHTKRSPAHHYAIVDLEEASEGTPIISRKNGWIILPYKWDTTITKVYHWGDVSIATNPDTEEPARPVDVNSDGNVLFLYWTNGNKYGYSERIHPSGTFIKNFTWDPNSLLHGEASAIGYDFDGNPVGTWSIYTNGGLSFDFYIFKGDGVFNFMNISTESTSHIRRGLLQAYNPGLYEFYKMSRDGFLSDSHEINYGLLSEKGKDDILCKYIMDASRDMIAVGTSDFEGENLGFFNLNELPALPSFKELNNVKNKTRIPAYINSPDDIRHQIIVCGHQLWPRKLDAQGVPVSPADFDEPQDLRHLIDFSEPWLDLNATGISDDGFIVGVGKKLKATKQKPVRAADDVVSRFQGVSGSLTVDGAPAYGPAAPEKCGLWDHDIARYAASDYEERAFLLIPLAVRTDADRDGAIRADGSDTLGAGIPWRFWVNDDADRAGATPEDPKGAIQGVVSESEKTDANQDMPGGRSKNFTSPTVNGQRDLVDFFPVHIEAKEIITALKAAGLGDSINWEIEADGVPAKAVWSDREKNAVLDFQKETLASGFGPSLDSPPQTAPKESLSPPARLPSAFSEQMSTGNGVFYVEGADDLTGFSLRRGVLRLKLRVGTTEITSVRLPLSLSTVEAMYRRINLRERIRHPSAYAKSDPFAAGPFGEQPADPPNNPDRIGVTPQKSFVMVHGYNVRSVEARATMAETFKRLFQSGSDARFFGITWAGDESWSPGNLVPGNIGEPSTPDYNANVVNAFRTAPHLKSEVDALKGLPGAAPEVVVAAHSLGNMLVSSAIVDYRMGVSRYLMIDPAIPREAFDAGEDPDMVNQGLDVDGLADGSIEDDGWNLIDWRRYDSRLWAANYWRLGFEGEFRSQLTWKNRFANIGTHTLNYHSSSEDVLTARINPGTDQGAFPGFALNNARQNILMGNEIWKGRIGFPAVNITFGGWMTNRDWLTGYISGSDNINPVVTYREITDGPPLTEVGEHIIRFASANQFALAMHRESPYEELSDNGPVDARKAFVEHPLFARFEAKQLQTLRLPGATLELHQTGTIPWVDSEPQRLARATFLAYAVPALSFPAGGTEIAGWEGRNLDMSKNFVSGEWPRKIERKWNENNAALSEWWHSDFLNVAYRHTWQLWDDFVLKGDLKFTPKEATP